MHCIIRMTSGCATANSWCHPDALRYCPLSSGWHNVIWTLSHPHELAPDRILSGWLMSDALCHPDDLADFGSSSGCARVNSLCHPDGIPFHLMSSGWVNLGCYLIQISYGNIIMSSGWHTLPFLSHPDEIANFIFSQHVVALQRFRMVVPWANARFYCWRHAHQVSDTTRIGTSCQLISLLSQWLIRSRAFVSN